MIKVTKKSSDDYSDIRISDGKNSFIITRKNAPDLYWIPDLEAINDNADITIIITENDGEIYSLFKTLYNNIISGNIFPIEKDKIQNISINELKHLKQANAKQKKHNQKIAQFTGLEKDGVIFWHSDDIDPFEAAAILKIEKLDKQIEITFIKNKIHQDFPYNWPTYAIRISESGSKYQSYFCLFVNLFQQLQTIAKENDKENTFTFSKKE